jgi:hypothetical protein
MEMIRSCELKTTNQEWGNDRPLGSVVHSFTVEAVHEKTHKDTDNFLVTVANGP